MANALVVLANGFEEIEAISVIDILRRGGVLVTVSSIAEKEVVGAHRIKIMADRAFDDVADQNFDMVILPGGEPGTTHLEKHESLKPFLERQAKKERYIAAICAAPRILDGLGFLKGKKGTSYPSYQSTMKHCDYVVEKVVVDGKIITSRGPGTAMDFGYQLLSLLSTDQISNDLRKDMIADR